MATIVGRAPRCPNCGLRVPSPEELFVIRSDLDDGDEEVRCAGCRTLFVLRRTVTIEYTTVQQ